MRVSGRAHTAAAVVPLLATAAAVPPCTPLVPRDPRSPVVRPAVYGPGPRFPRVPGPYAF